MRSWSARLKTYRPAPQQERQLLQSKILNIEPAGTFRWVRKEHLMELIARLERLPKSKVQRKILIQGGLGYLFDSMDTGVVAFILPVVAATWALTSGQTGLLGSSVYIGYMVGALSAGLLGDRYGRRRIMMYVLAFTSLATMIAAFSQSWEMLFSCRVLAGLGTGAESAIIAPYVAEFFSAKYRSKYLGLLSAFFAYGFILAAIAANLIVPVLSEGWRIIQLVTALPIVLLLWWRRSLHESPRFLVSHGRLAEAEDIVTQLESEVRAATGRDLPPIEPSQAVRTASTEQAGILRTFKILWGRKMAKTTGLTWVLWITTNYCYYGFLTFIPILLVHQGYSLTKSFAFSLFMYIMQLPGVFALSYLTDKMERKTALFLFSGGAILSAGGLAIAGGPVGILIAGGLLSMFMKGVFAILYIYTPEIYPSVVRASGMGAASAVGRIGSIAAPLVIGFAYPHIGFMGVFLITAGVLLIGVFSVMLQGQSTTCRSLEDITEGELTPGAGANGGPMIVQGHQ